MKLNITMMKWKLRAFFIKPSRLIAKFLLHFIATSNLVLELERRTDVCTTMHTPPDGHYFIDPNNKNYDLPELDDDGPAVILLVKE